MTKLVNIEGTDLSIREYNGQRVVTFKDIDRVHQRKAGTARNNFYKNKKHFIKDVDYFIITRDNFNVVQNHIEKIPPKGITVLTEYGYLMIVKTFTDDLSWDVQRKLVNGYFAVKSQNSTASIEDKHIFPKDHDWFRNNEVKIRQICDYWKIDVKTFIHLILKNVNTTYYFDGARAQYIKETGNCNPTNSDVITYFSNIREEADRLLNNAHNGMLRRIQNEEATSN